MARTSSAVLAALLAVAPVVAAVAQTAPDSTTATPVVTPETAAAADATAAGAAAEAASDAAAAADDAAKAATGAAQAGADAATAASDAATAAASDAAAAATTDAATGTTAAPVGATPTATGTTAAPAAPADTPAAAAPAADAATPPAAGAPAAGAAPAPAADQVGAYYNKSTHDAWLLRCLKTQDGKDPCELYQLLKDQAGKSVAEVSVIPFTGEAAAIINFVAPLETDLQAGLGLQIDAGKNNAYPFLVCAPVGCVSRIGLTEAELGRFKNGNKATVSLLPFGADPKANLVKLDVSLKGFTAGFNALQEVVKANQ
ncbi:invasion associated locus B family protein [Paracoccus sphaerophysae]|uniref:invasion associated locus B family protein n=1 Tax=Paracoccus sphaerophysae TaxID=690417 RepID=UPI000A0197A2|nr:invasion associated locus B family protein [Paracoccus sphaerophysae]